MDDPIDIEALKTRVSEHRSRLGLSLRAASEESGVPVSTLMRVEKGHLPDLANFRRLIVWLGISPEKFFELPRIRTESTPEVIAHHLAQDPNLSDAAAERIAGLVRDLYSSLVRPPRDVQVHLRAASTFAPQAAQKLGSLLETMQQKLLAGDGATVIRSSR